MNHNKLIDYIKNTFSKIEGVNALYLKGSFGRGMNDSYSDIDCYCLVDETVYDDLLKQRYALLESFDHVLYSSYVNFKYPQIIMIYDENLHLDFYLLKEVENQGFDGIKVIYDPNNLLDNYRIIAYESEIKTHLTGAIYTLSELVVAIKRQDPLWAMRLISHILGDLSVILSKLYSDKPVYHMKGLYHMLPSIIKEQVDHVLDTMSKDRLEICQEHTITLIKMVYDIIGDKDIDDGLLKYMMKEILCRT